MAKHDEFVLAAVQLDGKALHTVAAELKKISRQHNPICCSNLPTPGLTGKTLVLATVCARRRPLTLANFRSREEDGEVVRAADASLKYAGLTLSSK